MKNTKTIFELTKEQVFFSMNLLFESGKIDRKDYDNILIRANQLNPDEKLIIMSVEEKDLIKIYIDGL